MKYTTAYLYDPARHTPPTSPEPQVDDAFVRDHPEVSKMARRVSQLTDDPYLSPERYANLFGLIAAEVNSSGHHMTRVAKVVRDLCERKDMPIVRQQINFVLRGIGD